MPWTYSPIVGHVRWGKDHHKYGDPYEGVATLIRAGDKGYVAATCGVGLKRAEMLEFFKFCKEQGLWPIEWDHHGKHGQATERTD
jgi:hypothetical protein